MRTFAPKSWPTPGPGNAYRFIGQAAKDRANLLLAEIRRRGLNVTPIYWRWTIVAKHKREIR